MHGHPPQPGGEGSTLSAVPSSSFDPGRAPAVKAGRRPGRCLGARAMVLVSRIKEGLFSFPTPSRGQAIIALQWGTRKIVDFRRALLKVHTF